MLQDSSKQPDLPTSLLCFIRFTGYLLSRGSNTNCLCFALRSFLIRPPSTFQNFFTFTLLPGSSALLQAPKCSEYHPSEQSSVVSALSYQAPVIWNQLPVSVRHSTSVSSFKSSLKTFLFLKTFSHGPGCLAMRLVCVCTHVHACASLCVRVHVCLHSCCMH